MTGQMLPRGRRALGAHVSGYAAVWAYNLLGDRAADSIRHHFAMGRPDIAQQIADAVAELREAARQQQDVMSAGSGRGSAEAEPEPAPSSWARMVTPSGEAPAENDVPAAAEALGVTPRRVRQLLAAGDLAGRQDRTGRWSVDADDLARLVADRRIPA